jgi:two-component system CheB/CheR fusion protein
LPIDAFFRCLALDQGANAIGVVLSGTGSDGTLGIRAIKAEHGSNKDNRTAKTGAEGSKPLGQKRR